MSRKPWDFAFVHNKHVLTTLPYGSDELVCFLFANSSFEVNIDVKSAIIRYCWGPTHAHFKYNAAKNEVTKYLDSICVRSISYFQKYRSNSCRDPGSSVISVKIETLALFSAGSENLFLFMPDLGLICTWLQKHLTLGNTSGTTKDQDIKMFMRFEVVDMRNTIFL